MLEGVDGVTLPIVARRFSDECISCRFSWDGPQLQCRRKPPQSIDGNWTFPEVLADDWCGEFEQG